MPPLCVSFVYEWICWSVGARMHHSCISGALKAWSRHTSVFMCVRARPYECDRHGRAGASDHAAIRVHLGGLPLWRKGSGPESEPKLHRQKPRISIQQVCSVCACVSVSASVHLCVPTPRVTVPGHSLWMKVIASGGQPAAEAQRWCVRVCVCVCAWNSGLLLLPLSSEPIAPRTHTHCVFPAKTHAHTVFELDYK